MTTGTTQSTRWQVYVGIITDTTTTKNQRHFYVFCPELLPYKTGDITTDCGIQRVSVVNEATGATETFNVGTTATLYAEYFGFTSSMSVPTMTRGMQVLVLNYGNSDKYYWIPLERDDYLKTFEHVRLSCRDIAQTVSPETAKLDANDIEGKHKQITDDNSYYFEIDTKYNKRVLLSTANSDGEAWRYFIKMDAKEHSIELWDQCTDGSQPNNVIKLESRPDMDPTKKGRITLQTAGQATIILDSEDIKIRAPRHLYLEIGGDVIKHVAGSEGVTIDTNLSTRVLGNKVTAIEGSLSESVTKDAVLNYQANKTVIVALENSESQALRTTLSVSSVWTTDSWSLSAKTHLDVITPKTTLSLGAATIALTTLLLNNGLVSVTGTAVVFNTTELSVKTTTLSAIFANGPIVAAGVVVLP